MQPATCVTQSQLFSRYFDFLVLCSTFAKSQSNAETLATTHVNQATEIDHYFQQIVNLQMERGLSSFPHHLCRQWFPRHPKKFIMHSRLWWAICAPWRTVCSAANGLWEVIITAWLAVWSSIGQETWPVQLQCLSMMGILWWCLVSLGPERRARKILRLAMTRSLAICLQAQVSEQDHTVMEDPQVNIK